MKVKIYHHFYSSSKLYLARVNFIYEFANIIKIFLYMWLRVYMIYIRVLVLKLQPQKRRDFFSEPYHSLLKPFSKDHRAKSCGNQDQSWQNPTVKSAQILADEKFLWYRVVVCGT